MNLSMIREVIRSPGVVYVGGVVGGVLMGAGTTYLVVNQRLEKKYAAIADAEIAEARELYKRLYKADEYADLETIVQQHDEPDAPVAAPSKWENPMIAEAARLIEQNGYIPYNAVVPGTPQTEEEKIEIVGSQQKRIWDTHELIEDNGEFNAAEEERKKEEGTPYILEHDTFYDNDAGRQQFTLTYFEEDDVLFDDKSQSPVPGRDDVIGPGNLRFGYGTDQKNVVLIHNPNLDVDYEITRDKGSYALNVLGYEPRDRKSSLGRFRDTDG